MQQEEPNAHTGRQLNELLDAALDLPREQREGWLESLSADCEPLKPRLRALLAHAARIETDDFLQTLPKIDKLAPRPLGEERKAGDTVGAYRLLRELGRGGMACVWLAERIDGLIDRPVALKLPEGEWRRNDLRERMARERAILAGLDHPHIARLYDAGLDAQAQPYLALEYVDGVSIDAYCKARQLSLRVRLALFAQVASAVAYAHAKLVIHRDLKPSNILVTGSVQVKLLDFGIARILEHGEAKTTHLTQVEGRVLTPDYASPEQIRGESLSIASDIYSLGVILYELLAEVRPYRLTQPSRRMLEDAILQTDPRLPSEVAPPHLRRLLRGDLDTIALKALRKKPEERYATVNALLADIEAYLENRPVLARPDSAWYRARKLVIRNKGAVAAASAVLLAVLAGAGMALWQARVARLEQARAEQTKALMASLFEDADPYREAGGKVTAAELLQEARQRVDAGALPAATRIELLNVIAASLLSLEDFDSAEEIARKTLTESSRTLGDTHAQTLRARTIMLSVHRFRGRTAEMRSELQQVRATLGRAGGGTIEDRIFIAESEAHLSIDDGQYKEAVSAASRALALATQHFGAESPRTAAAAMLLAESYEYSDAAPEIVLHASREAFELCLRVYRQREKHPRVIDARQIYGRALARAGQLPEALRELEQAARDAADVFGPDSSSVGFFIGNLARYQRQIGKVQQALANSHKSLEIHARHADRSSYTYLGGVTARGVIWLAARRGEEGLKDLTESATGLHKLFGPEHEETLIAQFNRGLALAYIGRLQEGEALVREALQVYRTQYADPVFKPYRPLQALGVIQRLRGEYREAFATQQEVLRQIGSGPMLEWDRAGALTDLGITQVELGEHGSALATFERAASLYERLQLLSSPAKADVLIGLGRARLAAGRAEEALPVLSEADAFWRGFDAENRWAGEAALWLGRCYAALGRRAEALRALKRAETILSRSLIPSDARLVALARELQT
jgi:eukaryotic-like serine/threonine-protein kinase